MLPDGLRKSIEWDTRYNDGTVKMTRAPVDASNEWGVGYDAAVKKLREEPAKEKAGARPPRRFRNDCADWLASVKPKYHRERAPE